MKLLGLCVLIASLQRAYSFSDATGACFAGNSNIFGPHVLNFGGLNIQTGSLAAGGLQVLFDGEPLPTDGVFTFNEGRDNSIRVVGDNDYKGLLIRLETTEDVDTTAALVEDSDLLSPAAVCTAPVVGLNHNSADLKNNEGGTLRLNSATALTLDITVVNILDDTDSIYYYSQFRLEALPAPSESPSLSPSIAPSATPTISSQPSFVPTGSPSGSPSVEPSGNPSAVPSATPSIAPTLLPSTTPSIAPTLTPSTVPSLAPSATPSVAPTMPPSTSPSEGPTSAPSASPSALPSAVPSVAPTSLPSEFPTLVPSMSPSAPPSTAPSPTPTSLPSMVPSQFPTLSPSLVPSEVPSTMPTTVPSASPSRIPSATPTTAPSDVPSISPSSGPSRTPSRAPSGSPSLAPTRAPTKTPTEEPSLAPSPRPTVRPTRAPTEEPSQSPTISSQPSVFCVAVGNMCTTNDTCCGEGANVCVGVCTRVILPVTKDMDKTQYKLSDGGRVRGPGRVRRRFLKGSGTTNIQTLHALRGG